MSEFDYGAAVARGAALLDEKRPGWFREVKLRELEMRSCVRCMLGQLYGHYAWGVNDLNIGDGRNSAKHGFDSLTSTSPSVFRGLARLWAAEVKRRRLASPESAEVTP